MQPPNPETIALILSITANITGLVTWYNTAQKKRFASEIEFRRIVENQTKIFGLIEKLASELTEHEGETYRRTSESVNTVMRELSNIKGVINALTIKLTNKSISGFFDNDDKS